MTTWHYYSKKGEKVGPITTMALKALVGRGLITPETVIENSNGRSAVAGKVNGLIFPEPKTPTESEAISIDDIEPTSILPVLSKFMPPDLAAFPICGLFFSA